MRVIKVKTKKGHKYQPVIESQDDMDEYLGVCRACGEVADCVEPDGENYECEACGAAQVFGLEQLLIMGEATVDF